MRISKATLFVITASALMLLASPVLAQKNNTISPYSRFGLGDRITPGTAKSLAMGGLAITQRDFNTINPTNPASYTAQDSLSFIMDAGVTIGTALYSGKAFKTFAQPIGELNHVAIQFPLFRWLGLAAGFMPYSEMGYELTRYEQNKEVLAKVGRLKYVHKGEGGLSHAFLGLGAEVWKYLSVGFNVYFTFGSLNFTQNIYVPNHPVYADLIYSRRRVIRGVAIIPGMQAYIPLNKEQDQWLILAATTDVYAYMQATERTDAEQQVSGKRYQVEDNMFRKKESVAMPIRYAVAASYRSSKLEVGMQFDMQDWGNFTLFKVDQNMGQEFSIRTGAEYVPDRREILQYYKQIRYRAGVFFHRTGLIAFDRPIDEIGATVGVGLPLLRSRTMFHVGFRYSQRGSMAHSLIKEQYIGLMLGISFNDSWFIKRKYD